MFTGIIEKKAKILSIENGRFEIENIFDEHLNTGQSIAHDGACMTIEDFNKDSYTFFAMEESLDKTNFLGKQVGDFFNIERCLKIGDRIDGHFVTGHIDTVGKIDTSKKNRDESWTLGIQFDKSNDKYIVEKGSIAINGVSLTIVNKSPGYLEVCIIPLTLEITNLGKLISGNKVNLEFDMLGKYILNK